MPTIRGDEGPHPIDTHIGRRIRALRREHRLSQADLARQIGVTYQQVQKYETGVNRVSASALFDLARVLGEPVAAFYAGLPETATPAGADPVAFGARDALLGHPAGQRLLLALAAAPRPLWALLSQLLETLADVPAGRTPGGDGLQDSPAGWDDRAAEGALRRMGAANRPVPRLAVFRA